MTRKKKATIVVRTGETLPLIKAGPRNRKVAKDCHGPGKV